MLVLRDGDAVMLEKRPPTGIWGGLWSLPEAADEAALAAVAQVSAATVRCRALAPLTHAFTHFKLEIEPRLAESRGVGDLAAYVMRKPSGRRSRDIDSSGCPRRCGSCWRAVAAGLADLKQLMVLHVVMHDVDTRAGVQSIP